MRQEFLNTFTINLAEEKRKLRIILIARIFEHEKNIEVKSKDKYYYNDRFNKLYDMNFYHLEELERQMSGLAIEYKQLIKK